jgi:hypothetical protein
VVHPGRQTSLPARPRVGEFEPDGIATAAARRQGQRDPGRQRERHLGTGHDTAWTWRRGQDRARDHGRGGLFTGLSGRRLGSFRSADLVAAEVAAQLGLPRSGGQSYEDALTHWLTDRDVLLVIDNCEHVVSAVADLVEGLTARSAAASTGSASRSSSPPRAWPASIRRTSPRVSMISSPCSHSPHGGPRSSASINTSIAPRSIRSSARSFGMATCRGPAFRPASGRLRAARFSQLYFSARKVFPSSFSANRK